MLLFILSYCMHIVDEQFTQERRFYLHIIISCLCLKCFNYKNGYILFVFVDSDKKYKDVYFW